MLDKYIILASREKNYDSLLDLKITGLDIAFIKSVGSKDTVKKDEIKVIPLIAKIIKGKNKTFVEADYIKDRKEYYPVFVGLTVEQRKEAMKNIGVRTKTKAETDVEKELKAIKDAYANSGQLEKLDDEFGITAHSNRMNKYTQLFLDPVSVLNIIVDERRRILIDAKKVGVSHFLKNLYIKATGLTELTDADLVIEDNDEETENTEIIVKYGNRNILEAIKDKTLLLNPLINVNEIEKLSSEVAIAYKNSQLEVLQNKYPYMNYILD